MADASPHQRLVRVALDVPLRQLFDYRVPALLAEMPAPGTRVRVPFGRQQLIGIVIETPVRTDVPPERLKALTASLDPSPLFDPQALSLLTWAADYYHEPLGQALVAALPHALRTGTEVVAVQKLWRATPSGREAAARAELQRAPRQQSLLAKLAAIDAASAATLDGELPHWRDAARELVRRGFAEIVSEPVAPAPSFTVGRAREAGPPLTPEQQAAVESLTDSLGRFAPVVLHGVTGSGKTEVYLRLIERVLARGERALVLVPEIGLTPQLLRQFRGRFDASLTVLHSALTDQERLAAWREAHSGRAHLVLGTRSAVFAPLPQLGLIIVDEEHDASLKQQDGSFRYSARDLAVVRAQRAGVPIVLGSATPALDTLHNVASGRYARISLTHRANGAPAPQMHLIDLRAHPAHAGISTPALQAIERHLGADSQVLVFLNRRGYAPTLLCTACGWIAPCRNCDARLTVHRAAGRLRCHHCGADTALPERCPQCGFAVKSVGQGTERIAETLAERFGEASLVRLDRDVVRRRGDLEKVMHRIASGSAKILVGTQMVTKGHDFPGMTLVVVLNADQGLFSTDFRAPERLAQTIVQVAGRAGRGEKPGEVLIQTEFPEHSLLQSLLNEGYDGFARAALAERAQASWPPFSRLAALRDSAIKADAALDFLTDARRAAGAVKRVKLLGPVPEAMARRAGRYHAQLLIESPDRGALHQFLGPWIERITQLPSARRVRFSLDVDPLELY